MLKKFLAVTLAALALCAALSACSDSTAGSKPEGSARP